jgi:hypothetical protein
MKTTSNQQINIDQLIAQSGADGSLNEDGSYDPNLDALRSRNQMATNSPLLQPSQGAGNNRNFPRILMPNGNNNRFGNQNNFGNLGNMPSPTNYPMSPVEQRAATRF